jgi:hypothetical protein
MWGGSGPQGKRRGCLSYRCSKVALFVTAGGLGCAVGLPTRGSGKSRGGDGQVPPTGGRRGATRGLESYPVRSVNLGKALQA